jgi:TolB protein
MINSRKFLALLSLSLAFAGCYPYGGTADQPTSAGVPSIQLHAPPLVPRSKIVPNDPSLPDSALFPIVNIYGELRPAIYRSGQAKAGLSFQQHTTTDEGHDADVVLDPTGRWLAFSSTRHSERADIYLQRVDGTSVIQLTNDPADDVQPCFSADGTKIVFASSRSGSWDIYVMDIDGRNVEQLTNGHAQDLHPSFSPDGNRIVFCSLSRGDQWELWLLNLQTRERKTLGPGLFPTWSGRRDIDRIAFQRARQRGTRWFSIWTLDIVDGEPRRNTEIAVSANAAVVCPAWSPDGSHLAFTTILQPAKQDQDLLPQQEVWVINADGSGRQRIAEGNTNLSPFWAVNNRIFFISDRGGQENIWSVRVNPVGTATANTNEPQSNTNNKGPGISPPTSPQRSVDVREPGNP